METIEYRTIDKRRWPQGPWMSEPDKRQWLDEATGLPCLIVRQCDSGHLCGYVGVPEGHPCYGQDWNDEPTASLSVHGGVTFGDKCQHGDESQGVCHKPAPGEPDGVWWIGFDCAHAYDLSHFVPIPSVNRALFGRLTDGDTYRDFSYVASECASLAAQLAAMKTEASAA